MEGAAFSLGMIETWGFPALVAAADAAAKAADVKIVTYQGADAGIVTVYVIGDVSSVQAAVDAGAQAASRVGRLLHVHVIARPDASVPRMIWQLVQGKEQKQEQLEAVTEGLEHKSVSELRKLARSLADFPLTGIEISTARKEELLLHLRELEAKRGDEKK
ncbi:BMC domain-containing protein [Brevibacillus fluminis]|uniref:BMC domain-containing protein n=1 Tax=Brevibacillus fluminis TaxID=511487 RepID=A0A3M8DQU7_9BACL|nr:BMC domain-containing protein [Brevibacillus fluminis]RNB90490.1 BMC domain-containing protein [Brevibacillus fluminis]